MLTVRLYRDVEYTTAPVEGGGWRWVIYPELGKGRRGEAVVRGSESATARACRDAIDALLGPVIEEEETAGEEIASAA
jgi:hypothetical protein